MSEDIKPTIFRRLFERVFPKMPDFFALLTEQCLHVGITAGRLVEFMETGDQNVGQLIRQDEHEADRVKIHNLHTLNEAFSTPIDREDLYRAIIDLDEIVNYCKTTVSEMEVLGLAPDKHCLEMAMHIKLGCDALAQGYSRLAKEPAAAAADGPAKEGVLANPVGREAQRHFGQEGEHAVPVRGVREADDDGVGRAFGRFDDVPAEKTEQGAGQGFQHGFSTS